MTKFTTPYTETSQLGEVDYRKNRTEVLRLQTGGEDFYRLFMLSLSVTLKGTNTAATEVKAQEGILALIRKASIKINGANDLFTTSGLHLLSRHWRLYGTAIRGNYTPSTAVAEQTLTVTFPWLFSAENLAGYQDGFGLDLRTDHIEGLMNTAQMEVDWGNAEDIFEGGDIVVTDASLKVEGDKHISVPVDAMNRTPRASEILLREEKLEYSGTGRGDVELTRISKTQLIGLTIVQTRDGRPVPFNDEGAEIRLDHDDTPIKLTTVGSLRSRAYAERLGPIPDNMLFVPLIERHNLATAKWNHEFIRPPVIYIAANTDAAAPNDTHTLRVYAEYARFAKID